MRFMFLSIAFCCALTAPAQALHFDDFEDLKGLTVVEAGDLKKLSCPLGGQYNCLTWPRSFFRLNGYCLETIGGYIGGYPDRGLLTSDGSRLDLFVINGSLGSSDIEKYSIKLYECPLGVF